MHDFTAIDKQLDTWLDNHKDEMVSVTQELITIPSVKGQPAPGAPYGKETRDALDYVIALGERYGFKSKILDGYAAHLEMGSGDELIGVLSHVDVVPAGSDWKHDPFGGQLEDGKIYGRGAIDDKGPTISGLYALIAIKELGLPVSKRLRHILGADEESGFGCMHHYFDVAKEEMPSLGFTPDGHFPAIFAEKGIAHPTMTTQIPVSSNGIKLELSAGSRANMVPNRAVATISGINTNAAESIVIKLADYPKVSIERDSGGLVITAVGVGAHAAMPHEGTNAVGILADALLSVSELSEFKPLLTSLRAYAVDNTGACLDIAGSDEPSGPLTNNLGVLSTKDGVLSAAFSIRYPVTWAEADVKAKIEASASKAGFTIADWQHQRPLNVPKDSDFMKTLLEVYRAETGDMQEPHSIGGGTYAKVLTQGVAYGPNFPGFPDNAHQADEYWTVEDLMKASKIYAKALIRLAS